MIYLKISSMSKCCFSARG